MKTPIYFLALLLLTAPVFGNSSKLPALREESEVNDIPFSTELIFLNYLLSACTLDEELYVDDIPFNTESIAYQARLDNIISEHQESYVADIPFETAAVVANIAIAQPEESYVNDIPFSTEVIASDFNADHVFVEYYEEPPVYDFAVITVCIKDCTKKFSYPYFTKKLSKVKTLKASSLQIENLELKYPVYLEFARPSACEIEVITTLE